MYKLYFILAVNFVATCVFEFLQYVFDNILLFIVLILLLFNFIQQMDIQKSQSLILKAEYVILINQDAMLKNKSLQIPPPIFPQDGIIIPKPEVY